MAFLSRTRRAFSLTISHGMHLVIPTHLFLFWVVCHPNRTFPPKEFEWEPQNRLPLVPTAGPYPLLPLAHDPPFLYWLGTCWWCLSLVHAPLPCVSKVCLLFMRLPWPRGSSMCSAIHSWPLVAWIDFLILHSLWLALFKGWALLDYGLFSP